MQVFTERNYWNFLPLFGVIRNTDMEFIHDEKKRLCPLYVDYARKNKPLFNIINVLKEKIIVLTTTAPQKDIKDILEYFHEAILFDYMITPNDMYIEARHGVLYKSNPDYRN